MAQRSTVVVAVVVSLFSFQIPYFSGAALAQAATPVSPPAPGAAAPSPGAPAVKDAKPQDKIIAPSVPEPVRKPGGTQAIVLGLDAVEGIISKSVRSEAGNEDMGRIVDVLVGANGQTRAAVIDFGGFLGVGSRKVAVDWKALDFTSSIKSGSVKVSLTRDQVRQSPEYKADEPVVVLEGAKPGTTPTPPTTAVATPSTNVAPPTSTAKGAPDTGHPDADHPDHAPAH